MSSPAIGELTRAPGSVLLELQAVTRLYATGAETVRALGPVDIQIRAGEFVAIMGPSGSGKSTVLALAGALDRPTTGRVLLNGRDLAKLNLEALAALRRREIGFVFQELNLLPGLTAIENVALPLELDGHSLKDARQRAAEELESVGMAQYAARFPEDLSGGEQQRVAIARAFVGPRTMLLADEPTGALDSITGEVIMRLLKAQCRKGRTVVLVTHDATHAAWADRVLYLRDGEVVGSESLASDGGV